MEYKPQEIPDEVNVTPVHPLIDVAYLLGTVVAFSVVVYLVLGVVATQLATRISPKLEAKIGRQLLSTMPNLAIEVDTEQQQYLASLLTKLPTKNYSSSRIPSIHIQKSDLANAIIIPGGHIIVTTTLLKEAESENELAFVLAHELGHHLARDPLKGLGRSLVGLTIASILGIGSGNSDIVTFTGSLTDLHYSRRQETAADIYALSIVVDYYGHGDASLDFFKRIQNKKRDRRNKLSAYFSTHPLTLARIERLQQVARERGWQMTGEATDLPFDN